MISQKVNKLNFISLSFLIFLLDQLSKYLIIINFQKLINKDFIIFTLAFVKNYGAAFNIFSGSRIFLSIVSFVFSFILLYLILRKNTTKSIELYSYSFILGGSLGNGIDRIIKGYVIDIINLNFISFPVFNIADLSINLGFILILYNLFKDRR